MPAVYLDSLLSFDAPSEVHGWRGGLTLAAGGGTVRGGNSRV